MKAICTKRLFEHTTNGLFVIEEGEVIDYTVREKKFIIRDVAIPSHTFFNYFKVTKGFEKMAYSDFEYILCNCIFPMSVLFPEEYNGMRHLIIQNLCNAILITVNREETVIRISFDDMQEKYSSYEEALDGIKNHK